MKKYSVFISHSRKDGQLAQSIAKQIKRTGATVLLGESSIESGKSMATQVKKTLRKSDEVVAVVTSNSGSSPSLWFELGVAAGLGKAVTPIVSDVADRDLPSAVLSFRTVKSIDLGAYLAGLGARIKSG